MNKNIILFNKPWEYKENWDDAIGGFKKYHFDNPSGRGISDVVKSIMFSIGKTIGNAAASETPKIAKKAGEKIGTIAALKIIDKIGEKKNGKTRKTIPQPRLVPAIKTQPRLVPAIKMEPQIVDKKEEKIIKPQTPDGKSFGDEIFATIKSMKPQNVVK